MNDTDTSLGAPAGFSLADFQRNMGWFLALGILLISLALWPSSTISCNPDLVFFFGWILIFMGPSRPCKLLAEQMGWTFPSPGPGHSAVW